jgi:hypothetical protein
VQGTTQRICKTQIPGSQRFWLWFSTKPKNLHI